MKKVSIILTLSCFAILNTGCKSNNDDDKPNTPGDSSKMKLNTSIVWKNKTLDVISDTLYTSDQRPVKVFSPQFYISEVRFINVDGDTIHEYEVLFISTETSTITLSDVPEGKYEQMIFTLGLPHYINKAVRPIDFEMEHPLAPKNPNMWWNWDDGYIFARIEGHTNHKNPPVDSLNGNFSWHLGFSDNAIEDIVLDLPSSGNWTLTFDVNHLFEELRIPDELFTMNIRRAQIDNNVAFVMSESFRIE